MTGSCARSLFLDWDRQARHAVEALRFDAALMPNDQGTQQLVGELSLASGAFRQWWSAHRVHQRTHGIKRLNHPVVGEPEVRFETFTLPGEKSQVLYLYSLYRSEPGTTSQQALSLLASRERTRVTEGREPR